MSLRDERCAECRPGTPLVGDEAPALLAELDRGWSIDGAGHLRRSRRSPGSAAALALAVRCGMVAEAQGHHPDLTVRWGALEIELWTHVAGGLTRADFVLAARLDAVLEDNPASA